MPVVVDDKGVGRADFEIGDDIPFAGEAAPVVGAAAVVAAVSADGICYSLYFPFVAGRLLGAGKPIVAQQQLAAAVAGLVIEAVI